MAAQIIAFPTSRVIKPLAAITAETSDVEEARIKIAYSRRRLQELDVGTPSHRAVQFMLSWWECELATIVGRRPGNVVRLGVVA